MATALPLSRSTGSGRTHPRRQPRSAMACSMLLMLTGAPLAGADEIVPVRHLGVRRGMRLKALARSCQFMPFTIGPVHATAGNGEGAGFDAVQGIPSRMC